MNELPLTMENGVRCGVQRWTEEGLYLQMEARTDSRREGIVRAFLRCENGERLLGVMEPEGQGMVCRKRFAQPQLQGLGRWKGAVLRKSGESGWQEYRGEVAGNWGKRLALDGALQKEEGACRLVALPYPEGAVFPFTELFCLAHIRRIDGQRYVVYGFTDSGEPTLRR